MQAHTKAFRQVIFDMQLIKGRPRKEFAEVASPSSVFKYFVSFGDLLVEDQEILKSFELRNSQVEKRRIQNIHS